mgnify:CR=1 FL=1
MSKHAKILPVGLLAALLAVACGGSSEPDETTGGGPPAPVTVDPQDLEREVVLAPRAEEAPVPAWAPDITPVPAAGIRKALAYSICRATTNLLVCSSKLPAGARITRDGIRYSNIEPDHDNNADARYRGVAERPNLNQCLLLASPFAIANKLASLASDASKS